MFQFVEGDCDLTIQLHSPEDVARLRRMTLPTSRPCNTSSQWPNRLFQPSGLTSAA
jgi:hypothetical protein